MVFRAHPSCLNPVPCPAYSNCILFGGFKCYEKHAYLAQNGALSTGNVVRKVPTHTEFNEKTVYEVFFRFKSSDGIEHGACISTHLHDHLGDEAREPLVYDRRKPSEAVLLDSLPAPIRQLLTAR